MLRIDPVRSRGLGALVTSMHGLGLLSVLLSDLANWAAAGLAALIIGSLIWSHWRSIPAKRPVQAAVLDGYGEWWLECGAEPKSAVLRPDTYMSRWLVILRFRDAGGCRRDLVVARDAVPSEVFRRLRVVLNLARPETPRPWAAAWRTFRDAVSGRGSSGAAAPDPASGNRACNADRDSRAGTEPNGRSDHRR